MTNERIWWDGRYLPEGEPWGEVRRTSLRPEIVRWQARYGRHGLNPTHIDPFDTEAEAQAAVEQWVGEQGEK